MEIFSSWSTSLIIYLFIVVKHFLYIFTWLFHLVGHYHFSKAIRNREMNWNVSIVCWHRHQMEVNGSDFHEMEKKKKSNERTTKIIIAIYHNFLWLSVYLSTYLHIRVFHFCCYISCIFLFPVAEDNHLLSNCTGDVRLPLINNKLENSDTAMCPCRLWKWNCILLFCFVHINFMHTGIRCRKVDLLDLTDRYHSYM